MLILIFRRNHIVTITLFVLRRIMNVNPTTDAIRCRKNFAEQVFDVRIVKDVQSAYPSSYNTDFGVGRQLLLLLMGIQKARLCRSEHIRWLLADL